MLACLFTLDEATLLSVLPIKNGFALDLISKYARFVSQCARLLDIAIFD